MVKLLRILRGYVVFMISGSCPEKFVNILTFNGVNVWGVKSKEGVVYCTTLAANYKHIRRLSRRTSHKIRVKSKHGIPFFLHRNNNRVGLPIGLICFLIVFKILSLFVWNIEIYGFNDISYTKAKHVMNDVGIYDGVYNSFDSLIGVQTKAMIEFDNVSWITVNIDGSKGEVNISEVTQKGDIKDNTPYNIKAAEDGQIIRIDAYSGAAVVNSGDAVTKGNLLISGFVQTELGGTHLSSADGIVWADTHHTKEIIIPREYTSAAYIPAHESRVSCRLFNIVIPLKMKYLNKDDKYLSFISEKKASFQEETASLSLINENIYYYNNIQRKNDKNLSEKQFKAEMLLNEMFCYGDKKIISRTVNRSADENNYIYTVEYECEENIAEKSEILFEDGFIIKDHDHFELEE